jgi:hypothetical protein
VHTACNFSPCSCRTVARIFLIWTHTTWRTLPFLVPSSRLFLHTFRSFSYKKKRTRLFNSCRITILHNYLLIWGGVLHLFQEMSYLSDCDKWNTHHYVFILVQYINCISGISDFQIKPTSMHSFMWYPIMTLHLSGLVTQLNNFVISFNTQLL